MMPLSDDSKDRIGCSELQSGKILNFERKKVSHEKILGSTWTVCVNWMVDERLASKHFSLHNGEILQLNHRTMGFFPRR